MDLENFKLDCFACSQVYNCRYYQNSLWDWYMIVYQSGCPAKKYPFDSLYTAILREKEKRKEIKKYGFGK